MELLNWINEKLLCSDHLSMNTNAIDYLEANPHKINWVHISDNSSAIRSLEANPDKISWSVFISQNPGAIRLLEKNPGRIFHIILQLFI